MTAPGAPEALGPYSHAVKAAGLLFCSGQTPLDPATGALCLHNLLLVCVGAGARLQDAVRCGIYVTDLSTFAQVNEAYGAFFDEGPPARTTIGVASLPLGAAVEIDAIIALGD